jgi:hypothetical protein
MISGTDVDVMSEDAGDGICITARIVVIVVAGIGVGACVVAGVGAADVVSFTSAALSPLTTAKLKRNQIVNRDM